MKLFVNIDDIINVFMSWDEEKSLFKAVTGQDVPEGMATVDVDDRTSDAIWHYAMIRGTLALKSAGINFVPDLWYTGDADETGSWCGIGQLQDDSQAAKVEAIDLDFLVDNF
jgi:hypothetical protein